MVHFCHQCGGALQLQPVAHDPRERLVCQSCGTIFYQDPKVSACTVPVLNDGIVMVRRAIDPGRGLWVFPGGYMDTGETVEEAAIRETKEEVGLDVRLTGLVGVYSYRSAVVVIVYTCEVIGGELQLDHESDEVRIFAPEEVPWDRLAFPSTRDALRDYLKTRTRPKE